MNPSTAFQFTIKEKALLASLQVDALILFGSQAQGVANVGSDYDIGVISQSHQIGQSRKYVYDQLYEVLSKKINRLVDIDIVFLHEAPLELQYHTAKHGIVLYERNKDSFPRFRESVMLKYADFAPLRDLFQKATFARISS